MIKNADLKTLIEIRDLLKTGENVPKYKVSELTTIINTLKRDKKASSDRTNAWNKAHPEQHRKHCRDYARRRKNYEACMKYRGKNLEQYKKYQREYYLRVTKPKREALRKDKQYAETK